MKHIPEFNSFLNEDSVNEAKDVKSTRISSNVTIIGYADGNIQLKDTKSNEVIDLYNNDGSIEALYYFLKDFSKTYRKQNLD